MKAKEFIPSSKPRNFVAKNQKTAGAGAHKDKKRAEKQGDVKHKSQLTPEAFSQAAADRNKLKYQKQGRVGHGVGWKSSTDRPNEIATDIFDHFNKSHRMIGYQELQSEQRRHKFVEQFFKKYGYPFEVFPDVISLIDQQIENDYRNVKNEDGIEEGASYGTMGAKPAQQLLAAFKDASHGVEHFSNDESAVKGIYDTLKDTATEHKVLPQLKSLLDSAHGYARMEFDTNPGDFKNWWQFVGQLLEGLVNNYKEKHGLLN